MNVGTTPAIAANALPSRAADTLRLNNLPPSIPPLQAAPALSAFILNSREPLFRPRTPTTTLSYSVSFCLFALFCTLALFVFNIFQPLFCKVGGSMPKLQIRSFQVVSREPALKKKTPNRLGGGDPGPGATAKEDL
jgi:hypothetical protein